ncbi:MAG: hypothetical protein JOY70_01100, partial [Acidisphaera sp.]|nr:hypothetical protein [Acidisphaera sp.]
FLHRDEIDRDPLHRNTNGATYLRSTHTVFDVRESPGGLLIGARREAGPGQHYWRVTQWLMPWYTLIPPYQRNALSGHAFVPMDDHNCMVWSMTFDPVRPLPAEQVELMRRGAGIHVEYIPGTFRPLANRDNDYLMDRAAQRENRSYSGVRGFAMQDASVQESMGPIQDRTRENLVATDNAIIMTRMRLRKAAEALRNGVPPPGLDPATQNVRSSSFVLPEAGSFRDAALAAAAVRQGEPHVAV